VAPCSAVVIDILDMMMLVQGMSMDRVRCGAVKIYEQDVCGGRGTPSSHFSTKLFVRLNSRLHEIDGPAHKDETMHEMMI